MTDWLAPGYTEIRPLSTGVGGRVALARKDETGELFVIKYLFAGLTGDAAAAGRIRREVALIAGVDDPNLVRIHEVLDSPDGGSIALVMEALEGPTLRVMLSARQLLPEAALAVLRDSLLGLAAAHELGVVHRDFRPDNVLVTTAGQGKLINIDSAAQGAAAYSAPELWSGDPASPASDLYAAGVTFFECLTGNQPFRGTTAELRALHSTAPVPLDELPEPVRPLVARAMAKDPQERHSDARAFVADLGDIADAAYGPGWLEHGVQALTDAAEVTISSQSLPTQDGPVRSPVKRRRTLLAALAAVVVLAVVAVLLFLSGGTKPVVREPFVQALAALAKAPGVRYQGQQTNFEYFDVTMTSTGEKFGSIGSTPDASGKDDQAFVTVGGRDYTDFKNDSEVGGWIYEPGEDEKNLAPSLKSYLTPAQLAATLGKALDQQPRLPTAGDTAARSVTVNGTPAWRADTVDGFVYVTQSAPYRLLRWEPPGVNTLLKMDPKGRLPRSVEARTPLSDSRGMDVTPVTDAARLYGTVIQDTKDLANATTGASVQVIADSSTIGVNCSSSGCHVDAPFSGPVYNATSKEYSLTTVYIELAVGSITIDGHEVGGCTSGRQPFQLSGDALTGKLSCDNPQAGSTFDTVNAQYQGRADAIGGTTTFLMRADPVVPYVYPLSSADIDRLVAEEQHEQQSAGHV